MITRFKFKCNGWDFRVKLTIQTNQIVTSENPIANTEWEIFGVATGNGSINLKTGFLTFDNDVIIQPYDEINGKPKTLTKIKVEKYTLIRIKSSLNIGGVSAEGSADQKDNQTTNKQFDPAKLIAEINSLSDKDKIKLFETVYTTIPDSLKWDGVNNGSKFYMDICRAFNAGKNAISKQIHKTDPFVSSDEYFTKEFVETPRSTYTMKVTIKSKKNNVFHYDIFVDSNKKVVGINNEWCVKDIPVWLDMTFDWKSLIHYLQNNRPDLYIDHMD